MQEQEIKFYINSKGEKLNIKVLETTHLTNALAKKQRELFESANVDDYEVKLTEINDLKEELYSRFNNFREGLANGRTSNTNE